MGKAVDGKALRELDHHQRGVNISRAVGNVESVVGSGMGLAGAIMLFTPLAPIGAAIGIAGLFIGTKGVLLEAGANIANYVIGKNAIQDFDKDMKGVSIDRKAFTKVWKEIFNLAGKKAVSVQQKVKVATDFIRQVENWQYTPYVKQKEKYSRINKEDEDQTVGKKWFEFWRDEKKEKQRKERMVDILDFIATFWLKKAIGAAANDQRIKRAQRVPSMTSELAEEVGIVALLLAIKLASNAKDVALNVNAIVTDTMSLTSRSVINDLATGAPCIVSLAAQSVDEVGNASACAVKAVKSIGTTSKMLGIFGSSFGIIFSSISLAENISALENGSKTEKAAAITAFMRQIEIAFEIADNVANALRKMY